MIILYSTNCPRCLILKRKLDEKNISYQVCSNTDEMINLGFTSVPVLEVDKERMNFAQAVMWIGQQ